LDADSHGNCIGLLGRDVLAILTARRRAVRLGQGEALVAVGRANLFPWFGEALVRKLGLTDPPRVSRP